VLAATAGLRQGELLGLRWTDINVETGTLTVKRSLRYAKDGPYYTEGKRDRSRRRVELGPSTVTTIKAHRKRQNEERLAYAVFGRITTSSSQTKTAARYVHAP
jgi:integrase